MAVHMGWRKAGLEVGKSLGLETWMAGQQAGLEAAGCGGEWLWGLRWGLNFWLWQVIAVHWVVQPEERVLWGRGWVLVLDGEAEVPSELSSGHI